MKHKVYLIGAGPGRPDLITVRGVNILKEADVVVYDYLVDKGLLGYAREGVELICCDKLAKKGRYAGGHLIHQENISNLIVRKVKEGKKVARLKNGDVSMFSRLAQELDVLVSNKIDYELVPGVTAATGAAAYAGIPLTDRRFASVCAFVAGQEAPRKEVSGIDWPALSKIGTVVFYMGVENLPRIVRELIKAGKAPDTPCAIIRYATLPAQKVMTGTLKSITAKAAQTGIKPPAIIIVGDAVKLGKRFDWLRKDKKILFTGLSPDRFFIKGTFVHLPLIKIKPMEDYRAFDNYLRNIRDYDWIIFAGRYGVEYFFRRLAAAGLDSRSLQGIKIAAVGKSTKNRLLEDGIKADLVPDNESSKGLIEELKKSGLKNKKVFLPRSDISDKGLEKALKRQGADVVSCFAYRNVLPEDLPDVPLEDFDEIMFTSPSTVRNFKQRYGQAPGKARLRHIGGVTLREMKRCGLRG